MLHILAVHGICTPGPGFSGTWLDEVIDHGIEAHITEACWPSTGSVRLDLAGTLLLPDFRERAVAAVRRALAAFLALDIGGFRVVVAHSLGTVLIAQAMAETPGLPPMPVLFLGSPLSHPVSGPLLRRHFAGTCRHATHLWNEDDGVCALGSHIGLPWGARSRHPAWTLPVRVASPGRTGPFTEHAAELYLSTSQAAAWLRGV